MKTGDCALCGRTAPLTFHHLIPRKVHRRPRFARAYTRAQLAEGIDVCRLCHKAIHRFHDEMTLARELNTLAALRGDPALARHAAWAAKQAVRVD
jgi:5-methylcytosine-specific restriction endonuclease McrA